MQKFRVKKNDANIRADVFVAEKFPEFTRSSLKNLFTQGLVSINSKSIKPSHKLDIDQVVSVDARTLFSQPEQINLPVIYEDEEVIVMNKPAGVLTHAKGALNTEPTVASFVKNKLNDPQLGGNRAGIVHRLDRATSGVIIAAKNDKTLKWLQKQFSTRKVKKVYLAIVEGIPNPKEAIIDAPIERNPKKPQTFRVGGNGRPAITKYKVIKNIAKDKKVYSWVQLNPKTGRTHQLRVHLKYIGYPVVGDRVYGHGGSPAKISTKFQAGKHMYLHAKSLEVTLPGSRKMKFEVPEPKFFQDFIK